MFNLTPRFIAFIILIIIASAYNFLFNWKYHRLLKYFQENHPPIAENIKRPRVARFFYKGNAYQPSINYARNHEPLNDPIAETMLKQYLQLYNRSKLIGIGLIIWFLLAGN